ncbi:MAG: methyltransferase domain-containing protein [Rhodospirillales bacterium]|nr:methyltransferase domain-containing protein [Rhodospirillales bacterium]
MSWDPDLYTRFADHRLRPALDLMARLPLEAPGRVVDLGSGTGNVTALLAARWPAAEIAGVDSSPDMLAKAQARPERIAWTQAPIENWRAAEPVDLVFSNAALHWLDHHERLFPSLIGNLAPGGVLAVQMPRNHGAPSHRRLVEIVRGGPWRKRLEPLLREHPVAEPARYYDWLAPLARDLDIWETEYQHVLEGEDAVLTWIRGTLLRPFLDALTDAERPAFLADLAKRLGADYPRRADGRTLFAFRRLFLVAVRT